MAQLNALVVDDSSTSRTLLSKILNKMAVHCEQASSGEDALSQLGWYHPDLIFLDHLMPGMDGFDTLKAIKQAPKTRDIPVIMYTSQHAHRYYKEAHELGAAGVISKQIDRDKLYHMLSTLCSKQTHSETDSPEEQTMGDDIPTVYEEVRVSVSEQIDDHSASLVAARIATLETAYEELHDENRILKLELNQGKIELEALKHKAQRVSFPQLILSLFLALALFGSTYTWFTTQKIEQAYIDTQARIGDMNKLIDQVITIIEQNTP